MRPPTVALFGASVRFLAQSAQRAGFSVLACDLFGDEDLRECSTTIHIDPGDYPRGFLKVAERWSGVPRIYTGGLENHPRIVSGLAERGLLWGCSPWALRKCRAPRALQTALEGTPWKTPRVATSVAGVPTDGGWLLKPAKGSGGRGVKRWFGGKLPRGAFLQEFRPGEPRSASFLALADRTVFIGGAQQLIGAEWTGAPPFAFAGGLAPIEPSDAAKPLLLEMGERLRMAFGLRGLFGVDAVVRGDEWNVVEINPRPTASMELFEELGIASMFGLHHSAFGGNATSLQSPVGFSGKAILYAMEPRRLKSNLPSSAGSIRFADRPTAGTRFAVGDPVATVLATGDSRGEVMDQLRSGVARIRRSFLE